LPGIIDKPITKPIPATASSTPWRDQPKSSSSCSFSWTETIPRERKNLKTDLAADNVPLRDVRGVYSCSKSDEGREGHNMGVKIREDEVNKSRGSIKSSCVRKTRHGRKRSPSREIIRSKRRDVGTFMEEQVDDSFRGKYDERMKRLAKKRKYEEDRLEQVKVREEKILLDEKMLSKQQSLEDIDRRIKELEDERLKRERDLNLNEEELLRNLREEEHLRNTRQEKLQNGRSASPKMLGKKGRRKHWSVSEENNNGHSISESALKFFTRRFHKPDQRPPSAPRSVMERLGPIVSVKSRLGETSRGPGIQCRYCGEADHANATLGERKLYCAAFGTACSNCGKMNHRAKMCRRAINDEEGSAVNNNHDKSNQPNKI